MMHKRNKYDTPCGKYKSIRSGWFQQWKDDEGYIYIKVATKDGELFPVTVYGDGSWVDKVTSQKEIYRIKKFSRKN